MARTISDSVTYLKIEWKIKHLFTLPRRESEEFRFRTSLWRLVLEATEFAGVPSVQIILKETKAKEFLGDFVSRAFIAGNNRAPHFLMEQVCKSTKQDFKETVWWVDINDFLRNHNVRSSTSTVSFVCILMPETTSEDEDREIKPAQVSTKAKAEDSVEAHLLDFRRLLEDSALSDVTLKCGDLSIPAHRLILSARSEIFAAMLRNDMAECRTGVIEVTDVDPPILEQLLQFIYSCKLPDMSMDAATQLYEAADKYGVESLKNVCSAYMKENLTEGNACNILLLADSHSDRDLKDRVVSFIEETKLFEKDDVWLKFCEDHPKLAVEVLNRICKSFSKFV